MYEQFRSVTLAQFFDKGSNTKRLNEMYMNKNVLKILWCKPGPMFVIMDQI